ncbi:radical SAM protein [Lachnospiraceae bacterium ZAX-1]
MADKIKIDSHKLMFHPSRVSKWQNGENIYPIELEVGLMNACNYRCIFCAVDYMGYKPIMLDTNLYLKNIAELSFKGIKSIIFSGEGEPLLHKDAPYIINRTKEAGIDVAMSTNGVFLTPQVSGECLKSLTWIRFSVAAIKEETFHAISRGKPGDMQKVLNNMQEAVRIKKDQNLKTTLGAQLLLLPQNKNEILQMGKELRQIGVDYFTVKPFSQHPQSENIIQVDYDEMIELEQEIKELETDGFQVYFRAHAMKKLNYKRSYKQCLALPFMGYIDAMGNVWPCITFFGKEGYSYGNLKEESFACIWEGARRKKLMEQLLRMNLEENCRELCRLDEMNMYLDELKNPGTHVNFI